MAKWLLMAIIVYGNFLIEIELGSMTFPLPYVLAQQYF